MNQIAVANGFLYGLFYMVTFIWLGLGHRQGMSLRFAPLLVVAYFAPLLLVGKKARVSHFPLGVVGIIGP